MLAASPYLSRHVERDEYTLDVLNRAPSGHLPNLDELSEGHGLYVCERRLRTSQARLHRLVSPARQPSLHLCQTSLTLLQHLQPL